MCADGEFNKEADDESESEVRGMDDVTVLYFLQGGTAGARSLR